MGIYWRKGLVTHRPVVLFCYLVSFHINLGKDISGISNFIEF